MDKLLNEFTVNRPIDETWHVLTDLERIAPCMPGAQLQEIEGDEYRGVVKVKLGAITTAFKGQATFTVRDDTAHRAVLKAEGRDTGGKGNADALITATLAEVSAGVTSCTVETDLRVTGKVAQFGRGIMADVSKKLMTQFAGNLNEMLDQQPPTTVPAAPTPRDPERPPKAEGAGDPATSGAKPAAGDADVAPGTSAPAVRKIEGPAAEPIELSDVAGSAILKRLLPAFGGLIVLLLALRRLRK